MVAGLTPKKPGVPTLAPMNHRKIGLMWCWTLHCRGEWRRMKKSALNMLVLPGTLLQRGDVMPGQLVLFSCRFGYIYTDAMLENSQDLLIRRRVWCQLSQMGSLVSNTAAWATLRVGRLSL